MRYFFDPNFGYVLITSERENGIVKYGKGAVSPFDYTTVEEQRYTHFDGWVELPGHHVPDEWLVAFKQKQAIQEEKRIQVTEQVEITDGPTVWKLDWVSVICLGPLYLFLLWIWWQMMI